MSENRPATTTEPRQVPAAPTHARPGGDRTEAAPGPRRATPVQARPDAQLAGIPPSGRRAPRVLAHSAPTGSAVVRSRRPVVVGQPRAVAARLCGGGGGGLRARG